MNDHKTSIYFPFSFQADIFEIESIFVISLSYLSLNL